MDLLIILQAGVASGTVLLFATIAEARGEPEVNAFDRRIEPRTIRQALTVALLGIAAVMGASVVIIELTGLPLKDVLFESTSAFGTVGLSTGITSKLNQPAQLVIIGLMFLGRLGPATLVSALVLRERHRQYTLPEGRPLIG